MTPSHPTAPAAPAAQAAPPQAAAQAAAAPQAAAPVTAAQAAAMAEMGLGWLATHDATTLTGAEQADCLRSLEKTRSMHTAAQATTLAAFGAAGGHEGDGHPTAKSWLRWQTNLTAGAADGAVGWMRRLAAHPHIGRALAQGWLSESWARQMCGWSDLLPEDLRDDADLIVLGVAGAGAELTTLFNVYQEIRVRTAAPDTDGPGPGLGDDDGGFGERSVRLGTTFDGTGRLEGDLTAECAAAVQAVLESLGKKAGPEDTRTPVQRRHDALQEAFRRLLASGCLPQRAGQPTQLQVHMTLDQLRGLPGAPAAEASFPGPPAPPGTDCDAQIVPIVSGHVDTQALDQLAAALLRGTPADPATDPAHDTSQDDASGQEDTSQDDAGQDDTGQPGVGQGDGGQDDAGAAAAGAGPAWPAGPAAGRATVADADAWMNAPGWLAQAVTRISRHHAATRPGHTPDTPDATRRRLACNAARQIIIRAAADVLSGPQGLAAYLRTGLLGGPVASVSLPLEAGATVEIVPAHLRRLVTRRDRGCRFPGCHQPAMTCQPHHIIPRSQGGPTTLTNLLLLCSFHHLIAIHRWGWGITLIPDGTVTATSPDGTQTLHSHGPPAHAA